MLTIDNLVQAYIHTRNAREELKKKQTEEMRPLNQRMERIEGLLLEHLNTQEAESIRAEHGTAYKSKRTSVKILDWESALAFVRSHELFHMLERRLAKGAVEDYLESQGQLPPGVDITTEIRVNVRR